LCSNKIDPYTRPTLSPAAAETFSIRIFAADSGGAEVLPDPRLRDMWLHLRRGVLLIMRPLDEGTSAEAAARLAADHLFAYGTLAEQHLGR
jgi:hypothetical protein